MTGHSVRQDTLHAKHTASRPELPPLGGAG
jgi:hypothetical protein